MLPKRSTTMGDWRDTDPGWIAANAVLRENQRRFDLGLPLTRLETQSGAIRRGFGEIGAWGFKWIGKGILAVLGYAVLCAFLWFIFSLHSFWISLIVVVMILGHDYKKDLKNEMRE